MQDAQVQRGKDVLETPPGRPEITGDHSGLRVSTAGTALLAGSVPVGTEGVPGAEAMSLSVRRSRSHPARCPFPFRHRTASTG